MLSGVVACHSQAQAEKSLDYAQDKSSSPTLFRDDTSRVTQQ